MATIAITQPNVLASIAAKRLETPGNTGPTLAHEAVTPGQTAYLYSDGTYGIGDANVASPVCELKGIFENAANAGQPCSIVYDDPDFQFGGTALVGETLIGGTDGEIVQHADKVTGWRVTPLGMVKTTTTMNLQVSRLTSAAIA